LQKFLGYWIDRKFHHAEMNRIGVVSWPATIITNALAREDFLAPSLSLLELSARAHDINSFGAGTVTCFFCFWSKLLVHVLDSVDERLICFGVPLDGRCSVEVNLCSPIPVSDLIH
jgi:hypothetical protein